MPRAKTKEGKHRGPEPPEKKAAKPRSNAAKPKKARKAPSKEKAESPAKAGAHAKAKPEKISVPISKAKKPAIRAKPAAPSKPIARLKAPSKPSKPQEAPRWAGMGKSDVETLVSDLGKRGTSHSQIGVILRDQYGVPSAKKSTGKSISRLLADADLRQEIPEDLQNLIKRAVKLNTHLEKFGGDLVAERGMQLLNARIIRISKYYKEKGRLPANWKFNLAGAKLLTE